jgi:hypothetical protein
MVKPVYKIRSIPELLESIASKNKIKKNVTHQFIYQELDIDDNNDQGYPVDIPTFLSPQIEIVLVGNPVDFTSFKGT